MIIEDVAKLLHDQLNDAPWLTALGVDENRIILYVKSLKEQTHWSG
jgi:hypothetical protein